MQLKKSLAICITKVSSKCNIILDLILTIRGKSPITDSLLIPNPSRISVTIRDIKK